MPAGRPTIYGGAMLEATRRYLLEYESSGEPVPTVAGLAVHLKVSRETIYTWAKEEDKAEFSDIVEQLMATQELKLAGKGLTGDFNATMAKLMLTKHGYRDESSVHKTTTDLTEDELDRKLAELERAAARTDDE